MPAFRLAEVRSILHFVSDISTLYQVEPGPGFRLVDSNARAQFLCAGPKSFHGKLMHEFISKEYYERYILQKLTQIIELKRPLQFSAPSPFPNVQERMDFHVTPILNDDGVCTHIWVISRHKRKSEDLEYLAFHDTLTGVPNRLAFAQRLHKSITRYKQHHIPFAVMLIDCDNFKWVNDNLGHEAGDMLLRGLANRRLSASTRFRRAFWRG